MAGCANGGTCNETLYGPATHDRQTVVFETPKGSISQGTLLQYKHTQGDVGTPYPSDYQVRSQLSIFEKETDNKLQARSFINSSIWGYLTGQKKTIRIPRQLV